MDETAKRTFIILGVVLVLAALFTLWYTYNSKQKAVREATEVQLAKLETRFGSLATLEGEEVVFSPLDEKVKIVTHWASWCASCIVELQALQAVAETLDNESVGIYAFNRGDPETTARAFLAAFNLAELSRVTYIIDEADAHFSEVGGYTMPETIIYDGKGNIIEHIRGSMDQTAVVEKVVSLTEESLR